MHAVLENVQRRYSAELAGLRADTAQLSPGGDTDAWSVQQIVEHLALTCRLTAQAVEARLLKGRVTRNQERSWSQWVLQMMILSFGHMPHGAPVLEKALPVPGRFAQMNGAGLDRLLADEMEAMDSLLTRSKQKFGMERVAVHPLLGPLRVDQWRRYHFVHAAYYLERLRETRAMVDPRTQDAGERPIRLTEELQIPLHRSLT